MLRSELREAGWCFHPHNSSEPGMAVSCVSLVVSDVGIVHLFQTKCWTQNSHTVSTQSMVFSKRFIEVSSHHHTQSKNIVIIPKTNPTRSRPPCPQPPLPALAPFNLAVPGTLPTAGAFLHLVLGFRFIHVVPVLVPHSFFSPGVDFPRFIIRSSADGHVVSF